MQRLVLGLMSLCLMLFAVGCSSSAPKTVPMVVRPIVPQHLLAPLPAPTAAVDRNGGLLDLLAAYEQQRRRFNADRASIVEILTHDMGVEE